MLARCRADTLPMNRLELQLLAAMSGVTDDRLWDGAARDARHAERRT